MLVIKQETKKIMLSQAARSHPPVLIFIHTSQLVHLKGFNRAQLLKTSGWRNCLMELFPFFHKGWSSVSYAKWVIKGNIEAPFLRVFQTFSYHGYLDTSRSSSSVRNPFQQKKKTSRPHPMLWNHPFHVPHLGQSVQLYFHQKGDPNGVREKRNK